MHDLWNSSTAADWRDSFTRYDHAISALGVAKLPELERWYTHDLPPLLRAREPMHVLHDEMVRVTEWKMARGVWRAPNLVLVRNNAPELVEQASRDAAQRLDVPAKAVAALTALGGVGAATASAVLAIMDPMRYPFFDEIVAGQVEALGEVKWTPVYYRKYAEALVARTHALRDLLGNDWTAVHTERALWTNGILAGVRAR
jgi:hypothetical protein